MELFALKFHLYDKNIILNGEITMKRIGVSVALFFIAFIATYLACCYLIPGWRIKLEADTVTYFIESIRHMVLIKGLIALAVGLGVGAVPMLIKKK